MGCTGESKRSPDLESASGSVVGATGAIYCARRELVDPLPKALFWTTFYCRCR